MVEKVQDQAFTHPSNSVQAMGYPIINQDDACCIKKGMMSLYNFSCSHQRKFPRFHETF